ncbi:UNVERIFIED_CONTAM: hypothetical protein NCL1_01118 [Trichonephila clavipes]
MENATHDPLAARPDTRRHHGDTAAAQHPVLDRAGLPADHRQADPAARPAVRPGLAPGGLPGADLGHVQHPAGPRVHAHRVGCPPARRPRPQGPVPGLRQPPVVERHLRAHARVRLPGPVLQVLPQAGADLGAAAGPGLVGPGLPVHEALHPRADREEPGAQGQGHGYHAPGLRQVQEPAGAGAQLPRRHALHAREARTPGLALPAPAQAQVRRLRLCHVRLRRTAQCPAGHHHRLSGRLGGVLGIPLRPRAPRHRGGGAAHHSARVLRGRLRERSGLPCPLPPVDIGTLDRQGRTHRGPAGRGRRQPSVTHRATT